MEMEQSVPKRRLIKFRRSGITQKKVYNIQNTTKVWNQDKIMFGLWFCSYPFLFFLYKYTDTDNTLYNYNWQATYWHRMYLNTVTPWGRKRVVVETRKRTSVI